jgi:hypothetical protein
VARADHRTGLWVGLPDPEELIERAPHQDVVCNARFHIEIEGFLEGHAKPAIPPVRTEDYIYGNHRLLTELQPQIIAPFTRRTATLAAKFKLKVRVQSQAGDTSSIQPAFTIAAQSDR